MRKNSRINEKYSGRLVPIHTLNVAIHTFIRYYYIKCTVLEYFTLINSITIVFCLVHAMPKTSSIQLSVLPL